MHESFFLTVPSSCIMASWPMLIGIFFVISCIHCFFTRFARHFPNHHKAPVHSVAMSLALSLTDLHLLGEKFGVGVPGSTL